MYIRLHLGKMFEAKVNNDEPIDKKTLQLYYDVINFTRILVESMIENIEKTQI